MDKTLPDIDLDLHFFLTRAMARRHGVDLGAALGQGILARRDLLTMIARCRACPGTPADCQDYHEDHQAGTLAPPWCANAPVLEGLRGLV